MATAVEHMHSQQVAHRDLKPSNCMFACAGDGQTLKVLDMGLAKYLRNELSSTLVSARRLPRRRAQEGASLPAVPPRVPAPVAQLALLSSPPAGAAGGHTALCRSRDLQQAAVWDAMRCVEPGVHPV